MKIETPPDVPDGYRLMPPFGPFHEMVGPMYEKREGALFLIGMRVEEKHRNLGPMMHGGMICMLIDTAFTWASKHAREPMLKVLTTQLSVSMISNAEPGDWIEAQVDVVRAGKRVVFSQCFVWCKGQRIAQATVQFQVMAP